MFPTYICTKQVGMKIFLNALLELAPFLIIAFVLIYLFHETLRFIKSRDERTHLMHGQQANGENRKSKSNETVIQLELQAAERFALYLERIAPDKLVMRLHQNGMSARILQTEMLKAIREEFDHNLSQQIYVSEGAWKLIKNAKDEMVKFISAVGDSMEAKATGIDLSREMFQKASRVDRLPGDIALEYLRKETRKLFVA